MNEQVSQGVFAEGLVQSCGKWFVHYGLAGNELGIALVRPACGDGWMNDDQRFCGRCMPLEC